MTPILGIHDIHVGYDSRPVIRGLSMELKSGEIVAVLGRNGAGKSTLLAAIAGVQTPSSGNISLDGVAIDALTIPERIRNGLSYVAQGHECFPDLSVEENLKAATACIMMSRRERATRVNNVLSSFRVLAERRRERVDALSGGQQQILVLAMAMCHCPRVLLLDEPSAGLDGESREMFREKVKGFAAGGGGVLLVEQSIPDATALAIRAVYIERGRIEMDCTPSELVASSRFIEKHLGLAQKGQS